MKKIYILMIIMLFVFAGCSSDSAENNSYISDNGDLRESTSSSKVLPTFVDHHHDSIVTIYERVPHYEEVIKHMPCYCGCGDIAGHRSSYDCFIHDQKENGSLVWDEHGAKCKVCLDIAHVSMELHDKGVPVQEIRQLIDQYYEEGYAKPTKTPLPPNA